MLKKLVRTEQRSAMSVEKPAINMEKPSLQYKAKYDEPK